MFQTAIKIQNTVDGVTVQGRADFLHDTQNQAIYKRYDTLNFGKRSLDVA